MAATPTELENQPRLLPQFVAALIGIYKNLIRYNE